MAERDLVAEWAAAIQTAEICIENLPQGDARRLQMLVMMSEVQYAVYESTMAVDDLQKSIVAGRCAIDEAALDNRDRVSWLKDLAAKWLKKYRDHGNALDSLLQAAEVTQEAINIMDDQHESYANIFDQCSTVELALFGHTKNPSHLRNSITSFRTAIAATSSNDPKLIKRVQNLADALRHQAELGCGTADEISEAILAEESHLALLATNSPLLYARFEFLSRLFAERFKKTGTVDDLHISVQNAQRSSEILVLDHTVRAGQLAKLASRLYERYDALGRAEDLEKGLRVIEHGIGISSTGSQIFSDLLSLRVDFSMSMYIVTERSSYLDDAVLAARSALSGTADRDPKICERLNNLSRALFHRFNYLEAFGDLSEATELLERALANANYKAPEKINMLLNLSKIGLSRFMVTDNPQDLGAAVAKACEAGVIDAQLEASAKSITLLSHSILLCKQLYNINNRLSHLEAAIQKGEKLSKSPASALVQAEGLHFLGEVLFLYYQRTKSVSDLKRASALATQVNEIRVTGLADQNLELLLNCLSATYQESGNSEAMDQAVGRARAVLRTSSSGTLTADWAAYTLVSLLLTRFSHTGERKNLRDAIQTSSEAVASMPEDHHRMPVWLYTLSVAYAHQHAVSDASSDLLSALRRCQQALKLLPSKSTLRGIVLSTMGSLSHTAYKGAKRQVYLRDALSYTNQCLSCTPKAHPFRWLRLSRKASIKLAQWQDFQIGGALEDAMAIGLEALAAASKTASYRPSVLQVLSLIFREHFRSTKEAASLELAIRYLKEALEQTPFGASNRAGRLINMSVLFIIRLKNFHDPLDLQHALDHYQEAIQCQGASPFHRIDAAVNSGRTLVMYGRTEEAEKYYRMALDLLQDAVPSSLDRLDQFLILIKFRDIAANACAVALKNGRRPEEALTLLEQGRGTIFGFAVRIKVYHKELEAKHPELFNRFETIRNRVVAISAQLSSNLESVSQAQNKVSFQSGVFEELDELLREIRKQRGFEQFWKPINSDNFRHLAESGTIAVVICTESGSYAILISANSVRHLTLPGVSEEDARLNLNAFDTAVKVSNHLEASRVLLWLWKTTVEPIATSLERKNLSEGEGLPRVWWIGVGAMSRAPFHVAGNHRPDSKANTLSTMISSYTTTLDALHQAKKKMSGGLDELSSPSALLISMPETPGETALPGAQKEVEIAQRILQTRVSVTHLYRPDAATALRRLPNQQVVHCACHGQLEEIPFKSHLLLVKDSAVDKLTMEDIAQADTRHGCLAYLSACQTAETTAEGADEALNLVSAFQIAGFPHTIGTLWPANDEVCQQVAQSFYATIFTETVSSGRYQHVASALHKAVLEARARNPKQPGLWAPFVHFGP